MENSEIIELWKELKVTNVQFNFSCGADSMGDTSIRIITDNGEIENKTLENYFDREVYENVDFYVNSDGNYLGESGTVYITLRNDKFIYNKISTFEYLEDVEARVKVYLTDEEVDFINEYVFNIVGSEYDDLIYNYKKDFVLTDELEKIQDSISSKIKESYSYSLFDLKSNEDFFYSSDEYRVNVPNPIVINDNNLEVEFITSIIRYEDNN